MKGQITNYIFDASTKVVLLQGFGEAPRHESVLLITNTTRGVVYYNPFDSNKTATFGSIAYNGVTYSLPITLNASVSTTGHSDNDKLHIVYDYPQLDGARFAVTSIGGRKQSGSTSLVAISATNDGLVVDGSGVTQPVSNASLGATSDSAATTDTGTFSLISLFKRLLGTKIPDASSGRIPVTLSPTSGSFSNSGQASSAIDCAGYNYLVQHITGGGGGFNRPIQWSNDNTNWFNGGVVFRHNTPGGSTTTGANAHWEALGDTLWTYSGIFVIPVIGRYWRIGAGTAGGGNWTHYWYLHRGPFPGIAEEGIGSRSSSAASSDTDSVGLNGLFKRLLQRITALIPANLTVTSTRLLVDGSGVTQPVSGTVTASIGDGGSPGSLASGKIAWTPGESYPVLNAVRLGFAGEETYNGVGLDSGGSPLPVKLYTSSDSSSGIGSGNPLPVSDRGATGEATVSSFTSTTSATLEASNSNRKLLTIFNEGAGVLYVLYGSGTASTTNYSVRLLVNDYLEIEKYTGQVTAIFGSSGTARVTEIT